MPNFPTIETTGGLFICRPKPIPYTYNGQVGFWLMSDLHIGAPQVDYKRITRELEDAKANNERILINGDVFDMILKKDFKRYTPNAIHQRLRHRNDQVSAAIEWAVEILSPYADYIDMIGVGNHETAVEKHHDVDPVRLLVYELQKKVKDHTIHYGGYCGFMDYRFRGVTKDGKRKAPNGHSNQSKRFVFFYHHGAGGSAPVTRGMIAFARLDWIEGADVIWTGHRHTKWNAEIEKVRCPLLGDTPIRRQVREIQTGAYFITYDGQSQSHFRENGRVSNYAADQACKPHGKGGARVVLTFKQPNEPIEITVTQ